MRPLFAIAPLALAFALLSPAGSSASTFPVGDYAAQLWSVVFEQISAPFTR